MHYLHTTCLKINLTTLNNNWLNKNKKSPHKRRNLNILKPYLEDRGQQTGEAVEHKTVHL